MKIRVWHVLVVLILVSLAAWGWLAWMIQGIFQ